MLSNPEVWPILAAQFVAVRLDWEQGNHYRDKFGFVLGTGDQLLLKPDGDLIPPAGGKRVYGRHGEDTTPGALSRARRVSGAEGGLEKLSIEWFFWGRNQSATRRAGFYPPPVDLVAQYARLPIAEVAGSLPPALQDTAFLQRHVRQFVWKRGETSGDTVIRIRRVRDGLPEGLATELASLRGEQLDPEKLGAALDQSWLAYMKDRPLTARGYLENQHGGWMRRVAPQMLQEDDAIRMHARAGSLLPPGRVK